MNIAVIAHDGTKDRLRGFIQSQLETFKNHSIVCTKSTSKIVKEFDLDVTAVESGPLGGDAQIAAQIVSNEIAELDTNNYDKSLLLQIYNGLEH